MGWDFIIALSKESPGHFYEAFYTYQEIPGAPSFEEVLEPSKPYDVSAGSWHVSGLHPGVAPLQGHQF